MNHIANIFFLLIFISLPAKAQHSVVQIDFTKSGRGFREQILIKKDSVFLRIENARASSPSQRYAETLDAKKWLQLRGLLETISLTEVPTLKSPTMNRLSDGALHGTLTFTTEEGKSYAHGFDDENPNPKLRQIMKCIQEIRAHKWAKFP